MRRQYTKLLLLFNVLGSTSTLYCNENLLEPEALELSSTLEKQKREELTISEAQIIAQKKQQKLNKEENLTQEALPKTTLSVPDDSKNTVSSEENKIDLQEIRRQTKENIKNNTIEKNLSQCVKNTLSTLPSFRTSSAAQEKYIEAITELFIYERSKFKISAPSVDLDPQTWLALQEEALAASPGSYSFDPTYKKLIEQEHRLRPKGLNINSSTFKACQEYLFKEVNRRMQEINSSSTFSLGLP